MRLNEVANHAWDVRAGIDRSAKVDADAADQPVRLAIPGGSIEITDTVTVTGASDAPTATFEGPAEAVVRLLSGRLGAEHATDVSVSGNVTLDELRKVFPGY